MSGLPSQVLSTNEVNCIDQQLKTALLNIQKLPASTPTALVYFVGGSLPATALLHLKQLTLFAMICHLPGDPLFVHAQHVLLTCPPSNKSWFMQVRSLLLLYQLPHPLLLLNNPPKKEAFKRLVKSKVVDYWESKLRSEASFLTSLPYFQPDFLSLTSTHRLWTCAGHKIYEVAKARIQLLFLSSQYPCGSRIKHWSPENSLGLCTFPICHDNCVEESPEHVLLHCPAYTSTREKMVSLCRSLANPVAGSIISEILEGNSTKKIMQVLLDCSTLPEVISCAQLHGENIYRDLFYVSRNWCFALHRERSKRLGKWNFR